MAKSRSADRTRRLDLNANALTVLEKRYLVKDDHGKPAEKPEELFWRVASTIAAPDRAYGASEGAVEALSGAAIVEATRQNSSSGFSAGLPWSSLTR